MLSYSKEKRKILGAYYTPTCMSQILCDWAIRNPNDQILEPSFGGCGFIETSVNRLQKVGASNPGANLYGADIDQEAFSFLYEKLSSFIDIRKRFICKDFINLVPSDFLVKKFDVIIGNPPYISMHNMSAAQRKSCNKVLAESPYSNKTLGSNASLWAFFLLHSLSFMNSKGRMAWVLPSSALHANYATSLTNILRLHFERIQFIKLNERFFQSSGADEVSVVLLAEGFKKDPGPSNDAEYFAVNGIKELTRLLIPRNGITPGKSNYKHCYISPSAIDRFDRLGSKEFSHEFASVAKIVIGMVTGANKFFVLNRKEVKQLGLSSKDVKYVISRFSQLKGSFHDVVRHEYLVAENEKCLLVHPSDSIDKNSAVTRYLESFDSILRQENRTFNKRVKWYQPDDYRYPDAFLSYMFDVNPRLVINELGVNCTNSIHRVFFNKNLEQKRRRAICTSFLSSYTRLSVELEGRAYGSGVLKLEPGAAKRVRFLLNDELVEHLNRMWHTLDEYIAAGKFNEARLAVDDAIVRSKLCSKSALNDMAEAAAGLRRARYQGLTIND